MKSSFHLGFIGGGINSAVGSTHFIASQMDGLFKVVAGCFSRDDERNRKTAERWGISKDRLYGSYSDFLKAEKGKLDAVVILTPTPHHFECIVAALEAGYAVISEKALAASSDEIKAIRNTQQKHKGFLTVTYNYSGYPMLRELRAQLMDGRLGKVNQIQVEMPQEGFMRRDKNGAPLVPQTWRMHDANVPTIYLDLGVHVHHLVDFLTNERPIGLFATNGKFGNFPEIVDNANCIASYSGDIECSIWISKSAAGYRNGLRVRVFGEAGSAYWYQLEPEELVFHDQHGNTNVIDRATNGVHVAAQPRYNRFKAGHPAGFIEAFGNHYCDIANSLTCFRESGEQEKSEFVFSVDDALEGMIMLEAMAKSAKARTWESVSMPV